MYAQKTLWLPAKQSDYASANLLQLNNDIILKSYYVGNSRSPKHEFLNCLERELL